MDIRKMKERIADLMAKAEDKAATEAEANAALEMAMKLSEKYGVNLDDLKNEADVEFKEYSINSNDGKAYLHEVDSMLAVQIGNFCDVKPWRSGGDLFLFGLEADVELANFIRSRLKETMDFEWYVYKTYVHEGKIERGVRKSFMMGFANRVAKRMQDYKAKKAHFNRDETALVVRKEGLIEAELQKRGVHLSKARKARGSSAFDQGAYATGQQSGAKADIGRGMSRGASGLLT